MAQIPVLQMLLILGTVGCAATPRPPVEVLVELDQRPGNPAVTPDGRLLFSQHPIDGPEYKVVELTDEGDVVPFPTPSWSRDRFGAVIGIEARPDGLVWILDMGGGGIAPKLVAWDATNGALAHQIQIPSSVRVDRSFLQDLTVLEPHGVVVIADMTLPDVRGTPDPALIVVDIEMGTARRVLEGHPAFMPTVAEVQIGGSRLEEKVEGGDLVPLRLALNPISSDPLSHWVYVGAVSGDEIYRIPAAALADPMLSDEKLGALLKPYAMKAPSDGFRVDGEGRVFVTDLEAGGIGIATRGGYSLAFSDPELISWPDGLAFDTDGSLVVTVNQLHLHPNHNGGLDESRPPYRILRLNGLKAQVDELEP